MTGIRELIPLRVTVVLHKCWRCVSTVDCRASVWRYTASMTREKLFQIMGENRPPEGEEAWRKEWRQRTDQVIDYIAQDPLSFVTRVADSVWSIFRKRVDRELSRGSIGCQPSPVNREAVEERLALELNSAFTPQNWTKEWRKEFSDVDALAIDC